MYFNCPGITNKVPIIYIQCDRIFTDYVFDGKLPRKEDKNIFHMQV